MNELLLQSTADEIRIAPATPDDWDAFAFKLRCRGDIVVEARAAARKLQTLTLHRGEHCPAVKKTLIIPQALYAGGVREGASVDNISEQNGQVKVALKLTPGASVIPLIQ